MSTPVGAAAPVRPPCGVEHRSPARVSGAAAPSSPPPGPLYAAPGAISAVIDEGGRVLSANHRRSANPCA